MGRWGVIAIIAIMQQKGGQKVFSSEYEIKGMVKMNDILALADSDNNITSVDCGTLLNINVEKWNGVRCCIVGTDCYKLLINGSVEFEIGEIVLKNAKEFNDEFENEVIAENNDYSEYEELIIYDAWITDRINLRAIAKSFKLICGR